jgi:hypothetical protein
MSKHVDVLTALAVYAGQTLLGFLAEQRCGRFAAYDAERHFLGEFANRAAAMNAITAITGTITGTTKVTDD